MDCPYCKGSGILKHPESVALEVLRHLKLLVGRGGIAQIEVSVHPEVADHINNAKRATLVRLEADNHKRIRIRANPTTVLDHATYRALDDRAVEMRMDVPPPPPPPKEEPRRQDTPEE
jgi:ribonuclease E